MPGDDLVHIAARLTLPTRSEANVKCWIRGAVLGLILGASGCLSVDDVGLRASEADAGPSRDGGETDAGSAAGAPRACVDRGTYQIDGVEVQGRPDGCEDGLVCVEGLCVEEPACTAGVRTACRMLPAAGHGLRSRMTAVGTYLYWLESGTVELGAYRNDGALVRLKPGLWQREVVLDALDFFDDATNTLREPGALRWHNGWLHFDTASATYVVRFDGSHRVTIPEGDTFLAIDADGTAFFRRAASAELVAQRAGEPDALMFMELEDVLSADAHEGKVLVQQGDWLTLVDPYARLSAKYHGPAPLLGYVHPDILRLRDGAVSRATLSSSINLDWEELRPVTSVGDGPLLTDHMLTWASRGDSCATAVVLEASLDDDASPRVLAEMCATAPLDVWDPRIAVSAEWTGYDVQSVQAPEQNAVVHFVPRPVEGS